MAPPKTPPKGPPGGKKPRRPEPIRDGVDKSGPKPSVPSIGLSGTSGLPKGEPDTSPGEQRRGLEQSIASLESAFRFMGTGHPDFERTRTRIEQLKTMLARLPA